jgi:hypothetical protein
MMDMQPEYPSVPGQAVPDLGLATYGIADSRTAIYPNSDSTGAMHGALPPLQSSDIANLGIDPGVPYFDLQLANQYPTMNPAQLSASQGIGGVNVPTFAAPDMSVPDLLTADLQAPEIEQGPALTPDPLTADLIAFVHPSGLDIIAASSHPLVIDPMAPDLGAYDRPAGLGIPGPLTPDPLLPDLQEPELEQQMHMQDRPGDLASDALGEMHDDPTYQARPTSNPKALWMQQPGNSRRARHLGLLTSGLDSEAGE